MSETANMICKCMSLRRSILLVLVISSLSILCLHLMHSSRYVEMTSREYFSLSLHNESTTQSCSQNGQNLSQSKFQKVHEYLNVSSSNKSYVYPPFRIGKYILINPDICRSASIIDIIIIVHTAPSNFVKRQRIRDSYANEKLFKPFHVKIAFLLGKTEDEPLNYHLFWEHNVHRDTVMGDFIDHYHNLTLKGLMGFRWVGEYCPNSRFVLKVDDDVVVNTYDLIRSLPEYDRANMISMFCNLWPSHRIAVNRWGKWAVSSFLFHGLSTFPYSYCSGFFVLIKSNVTSVLFDMAKRTPYFWIDDVYLFGILPKIAGCNLRSINSYGKLHFGVKHASHCLKTESCHMTATLVQDHQYWIVWRQIQERYANQSSVETGVQLNRMLPK